MLSEMKSDREGQNTAWYHLHVDSKTRKENQIE